MGYRVGIGHDTHRLEAGRRLLVGGVHIPFEKGPVGHSDGDVLIHALVDAILGACGLGDIGEWFPDTSPEHKDRDSMDFLRRVCEATPQGWSLVNVDAIVFLQEPKLGPFKEEIRARLASELNLPRTAVNVKAKTGERVGPVGRGKAISAEAIVLVTFPDN